MKHLAWALLGMAALAACGGRPASPVAAPASPRPSGPAAGATAEPVYIETKSTGGRYPTIVEYVADRATKHTRIAYELRALSSQAVIVGSKSVGTFVLPHVIFHDRRGKTLVADAPQAKVTQQDKGVLMSGGVRARAADGSVLTCDTLRYDGRTEQLHGEGHVVLTARNDLTLSGRYLDGDVRLDDVRVAQSPL